jgi:hypothetical protein
MVIIANVSHARLFRFIALEVVKIGNFAPCARNELRACLSGFKIERFHAGLLRCV